MQSQDVSNEGSLSMYNSSASSMKPDSSYSELQLYPGNGLSMYQNYMAPSLPAYNNFCYPPQPSTVPMSTQMAHMFATGASMPAMPHGFNLGEGYGENIPMSNGSGREYAPLIKDKTERDSKLDEVSGRLCLLSGTRKYKVTVGEICRRMSIPETLHTSLINSILRNAKAKDNGCKLRSNLRNYNIDLPQGRRKTCKTTGFTALCEEEANQLAKDYTQLLMEKGGAEELAKDYVSELAAQDLTLKEMSNDIAAYQRLISYFLKKHNAELLPDDMEYNSEAEKSVVTLSLFTHGFSHVANSGVFKWLQKMVEVMQMQVTRRQEEGGLQQPPGRIPMMPGFFPHPQSREQ